MAIVLDDKDPVFGGAGQKQGLPKSPAPAPAPAPAAVYDYQQFSDPYTAVPDSQGYDTPLPSVVDSEPYWVNDPTLSVSGGGYTLNPVTGEVWIEAQGRWGSLDELRNIQYGAGTGMYGEYVAPGGEPTPPSAVERLAPEFLDFATDQFAPPPPPAPAPVIIKNQQVGYTSPWTDVPYAEDFAPDSGPSLTELDMTPSSRTNPNITSAGNVWDSTMQTWIDPNGYIENPFTKEWQTPDEYATFISGGTPSLDYGITRNAISDAMAGKGGPYVEPDQTFDALGPFPGSSVYDLPPSASRSVDLSRISDLANTARLVEQYRDPSPYQFSAPPAPSGAPQDLPGRLNKINPEAYGVDPRDTNYVFSGIDPVLNGLAPGSIPNAWYAVYPNGVQILLKSPTEDLIGVDDVVKAGFVSFVSQEQADYLAKIIVDAAANNPRAAGAFGAMAAGGSLLLSNPIARENTEKTISNAIRNNATPVGLAGLVIGGPISNAAFEAAFASTQTLLDNTPLPEPVKVVLEFAAGGLAAIKTGNIGAAGISSIPGFAPDATKLSGRTADDLAGLSLQLTGKEKVVTSLQAQKLVQENIARGSADITPRLLEIGGVKRWVQTADPAQVLNSNGSLRSSIKVVDEVTSEDKTYLVMYDPVSGKKLHIEKVAAAKAIQEATGDNLLEAVRPTSLKAGDKVLLSDATQGASFGSNQKYTVADDIQAVGPGTRVAIKSEAGDELTVDAGRIWKVGENDDNIVYFNAGVPLKAVDESLTKVWGALNRVWVRTMEADTGPRVGVVLHPAGIDNIGRDLPTKQFAKEFDKMIRQLRQTDLPNAVETVSSSYQLYRRDLGRIKDGRLLDIPASALEKADNVLHPRLGDVVQNLDNYKLTDKQRQAVLNIRGLISQVEAEKRLRGVDEKFLNADNGLGYFPREVDPKQTAVLRGEVGRTKAKLSIFWNEETGSAKLSTRLRDDRVWETEHEGEIRGRLGYLKDDVEVFTNWAREGLTSAANKHVKNVADTRGVTAAEVMDPKYKMRVDQTKKAILSLRERLNTAMKRAGMYKMSEDDLGRVLDDALRLAPDEPTSTLGQLPRLLKEERARIEKLTFRPVGSPKEASESVASAKRLVTEYKATLKSDIANLKRAAEISGSDGEKYNAAKRTAESLLERAAKLDQKVDDATSKVNSLLMDQVEVKESLGRAVPGGRRRVKVSTESYVQGRAKTRSSLAAARELVADINKELAPLRTDLRKLETMETRAWSAAEKADAKLAAANTSDMFAKARYNSAANAANETVASLRDVVQDRVGSSLERLYSRIDEVLPDGLERLKGYDAFVERSDRHLRRLSELGGKWTDISAELRQELDSAKIALGKYREVFENVKQGEEFRLELGGGIDLSPAKSGSLFNDKRYYEKEVGQVLKKWFDEGKRRPPPWLLTTLNNIYIPLVVTADFSSRWATLRRVQMQLGLMKPGATLDANTATAREAIAWGRKQLAGAPEYTSKADYLVWRTDPRTAFAARYMPFRNESSPGEFIFTRGIGRMHGFKETEMDFTRTWNRVMVEFFYAQADALRASGKVLTDADYEAIGRASGRMGGIPWNRSGEWESALNFAANFFRSHAELHYYALAKGGVEGSLARQQLLTNYMVTSTIVGAFAMWQGRDVMEVLNPIDTNALERGEIRLNPNFMTVRLGSGLSSVDMNVGGEIRSLYYLMWAAGEGLYMSAYKQDLDYLRDAVYYASSTRGQLPVKLVADFSYGRTFDGKSLTDWSGWAQRITPITFQNIWDNAAEGNMSISNQFLAGALAMVGASVSPVTNYERRDMFIAQMERFQNMSDEDKKFYLRDPNRPPSWNNLKANGRLLIDGEYGKLEVSSWDAKVRARKVAEVDAQFTEKLQNINTWWKTDKSATTDDLQKKIRDAKTEYFYARDLIYGQYDYVDSKDPVQVYRSKMREFEIPGVGLDFDGLEEWLRKQPADFQREVDAYYSKPISITGIDIFDRLNTNSRQLSDLGYYNAQDSLFAEWAADQGLPAGTTLQAYKLQLVEGELKAYADAIADRPDAKELIDSKRNELWDNVWQNENMAPWYDYFYEEYTRDFITENPLVALEADTFHRLSVRKEAMDAIRELGTTDSGAIRSALEEGDRLDALLALPDEWSVSAWASFTLPSELGIKKAGSYQETKEAWVAEQYGAADYDSLTSAQKKIGTQNWDKLLDDNQDSWYVVDRQNRISNFLTLWDNMESEEEKEYLLTNATTDAYSNWKWTWNNKSDAAILYRAAVMRNDTKLMKWIEENAPAAVTYKVDSIKYANLPDAALAPSK